MYGFGKLFPAAPSVSSKAGAPVLFFGKQNTRPHRLWKRFSSPLLPPSQRPGSLLYSVHCGNETEQRPCVFHIDRAARLVGLLARALPGREEPTAFCDGKPVAPAFARHIAERADEGRAARLFRLAWIRIPKEAREFRLRAREKDPPFLWEDREYRSLPVSALLAAPPPPPRSVPARCAKFLALLPPVTARYRGCWLFVDRDCRADDNAEHLYRWVMRRHPERNIFFGLDRRSPDWPRLAKEGFRLVALGSFAYFFAWMHAEWLLSSNATGYIRKYNWRRAYADCVTHRFCFLQHGVTKDYIPDCNLHPVDALVTATRRERDAFACDPRFPYVFTGRETLLTGFPRHDALREKAAATRDRTRILIAPTWRKNLTSAFLPGTGRYPSSEYFRNSLYCRNWNAVLRNETLREAAKRHDLSLCFLPHVYTRQQLRDFDLSHCELCDDAGTSVQDLLAQTALFITDYSSTAMEAACIGRAVLYFQFDRESFTTQDHSYVKGYFDYDSDGFGDVAIVVEDLIAKAVALLEKGCAPDGVYAKRAEAFFTFRDMNNCKRVYDALCAL